LRRGFIDSNVFIYVTLNDSAYALTALSVLLGFEGATELSCTSTPC